MNGGILYSLDDGHAHFIDSTFTNNYAIQNSLVYAINSQNQIIFEGGKITRNGLKNNDLEIEDLLNMVTDDSFRTLINNNMID